MAKSLLAVGTIMEMHEGVRVKTMQWEDEDGVTWIEFTPIPTSEEAWGHLDGEILT